MKKVLFILSFILFAAFARAQNCKPFLTGASSTVDADIGVVTWTKVTYITNPYTPVWQVRVNGAIPDAIFWVQQTFCSDSSACEVIYRGAYSACLGMVSRNGTVGSIWQYNLYGGGYYFVARKYNGSPGSFTYSKTYYIPYKPVVCDGCHDQCSGDYNSHP